MSSAYYRAICREKERELRNYNHRKNELMKICGNYGAFDADALRLDKHSKTAADGMRYGILISGGSENPDMLFGMRDGGSGSGELSVSRDYVNAEIRRVEQIILELHDEISNLQRMIQQEEQREQEEQRQRQIEEQRQREIQAQMAMEAARNTRRA